jgi:hypothetical protein
MYQTMHLAWAFDYPFVLCFGLEMKNRLIDP